MRRIPVLLWIVSLGLGIGTSCNLASENTVGSLLARKHFENLNLLVNLNRARITDLRIPTRDPKFYQRRALTGEITSWAETYHAIIYGYDGVEIPDFLIDHFDRIFRMIIHYFKIKDTHDKVVIWVMDLQTLQQMMAYGSQSPPAGSPRTVVSLYTPIFDYLFFTPQHTNDYYVTHELLHYFIDNYEEEVIIGLPQTIKEQKMGFVSWHYFLKGNEEKIVIELAQIIFRWSEHRFWWRKR